MFRNPSSSPPRSISNVRIGNEGDRHGASFDPLNPPKSPSREGTRDSSNRSAFGSLVETTNTLARPRPPPTADVLASVRHPVQLQAQDPAFSFGQHMGQTGRPFSTHLQGFDARLPSSSTAAGPNLEAGASNRVVHLDNDPRTAKPRYPPPNSNPQRYEMSLIYQNETPSFSDDGVADDRSRQGSGHQRSLDQPEASNGQDAVHFWPVPRLVPSYPANPYVDSISSQTRMAGMAEFLPSGLQQQQQQQQQATGAPSYIYGADSSPALRHPVVYSQPAGYGQSGTWSTSSTPTTEYPTAPYIAETRRLHQDQELRQRYMHDMFADRVDEGTGVGLGVAGIAADPTQGMAAGFYDHSDAALWPLGPSQLAAVAHVPDYADPLAESIVGSAESPDHTRPKIKTGPQVPPPKQFKCSACDAIFSRNHDLKRHARIHLAVKPFPCMFCDKAFSRKDALKRHVLVKGCGIGNKKNGAGRKRAKAGQKATDMAEASTSRHTLDAEDGSPDSSLGSQHCDFGQRDSDGGSVAQDDVHPFDYGAQGGSSWRSFPLNEHDAQLDGAAATGGQACSHPKDSLLDFPLRASQPSGPPQPPGAFLDVKTHAYGASGHRMEPIPGTGRAQVQSNSLANAYPPDMLVPGATEQRAQETSDAIPGYSHDMDPSRQGTRPGSGQSKGHDGSGNGPSSGHFHAGSQVKSEPGLNPLHNPGFVSSGSTAGHDEGEYPASQYRPDARSYR